MKKIILAYSGGLDTSYCVAYLKEQGYEVHAVSVQTGGFTDNDIADIKKRALLLGAASYHCIDAQQSYYEKVIKYLIFGNVLKNHTYPLSVSAERIIQAIEILNYAKSVNASAVAHGSTGAGNDQVRFDSIFQILAPEIQIVTPIRDQQLSRQQSIAYLQERGIDLTWEKAQYSINKGLWGTSVGGSETLGSRHALPEEAYPSQLMNSEPEVVELEFNKGELSAVNGEQGTAVALIKRLQELAGPFAIGRDIHVGDTIIGLKGRVGFEAAAPMILIKAHQLLEKHVLSKWQLQHKDYLSTWYGQLLHEGLYLDESMRNIEAFFTDSQKHVTGKVWVRLYPYRFVLEGISSEYDLMHSSFGSYGETQGHWDGRDAQGFIKIASNAGRIQQMIKQKVHG